MLHHRLFQTRGRQFVVALALAMAVPAFSSTIVAISGDHSTFGNGTATEWSAEGKAPAWCSGPAPPTCGPLNRDGATRFAAAPGRVFISNSTLKGEVYV